MPENPSTADRPRATEDSGGEHAPATPLADESRALEAKVVETPDRADRRTIYPPGLTGMDRMEQWLTAETHAFVDLRTWR